MSVITKDVYTCDKCKTVDFNIENGYDIPLEWLTIRISSMNTCAGSEDLHICPSCKYEERVGLWESI